jgi:hypothetical protein
LNIDAGPKIVLRGGNNRYPSQRRINVKKLIFASLLGVGAMLAAQAPAQTPASSTSKKTAKKHKTKKAAKSSAATPAK